MRSFLVCTESGPILILTSCASPTEEALVGSLHSKGIDKYIAYELPLADVHRLYGLPFEVVASDIEHGRPVRVLDFNGLHIFDSLSLSDLGRPVAYEH
jgi:hypothetical protein